MVMAVLATFAVASEAHAQYVTLRAPTAVVPIAGPVVTPVYTYPTYGYSYPRYAVPPVVVNRPVVTTPVVTRPYGFYSNYGGYEVRVPGRPVANTLRALIR
ncbi:hypothetical protein CGZ80_06615 [Rhodopirellula sp. MGV]|nr:hypothetical protein CGZ80_06615 [Rhodopirellula sp. MGV]